METDVVLFLFLGFRFRVRLFKIINILIHYGNMIHDTACMYTVLISYSYFLFFIFAHHIHLYFVHTVHMSFVY